MQVTRWDRDRVAAFAAGTAVCFRGLSMQELEVPDWVIAAGASSGTSTVLVRIRARHPSDRDAVFEASLAIMSRPREVMEVRCRTRHDDRWMWERVRFVNLLDEPDLGVVVMTSEVLGPLDAEDIPEVEP